MEEHSAEEGNMEEDNDVVELGGNIELSGFGELDNVTLIVLKKIIGNYAKKMSDQASKFEKLSLRMKTVHQTEQNEKYEVKAKMIDGGQSLNADVTDRNLIVAVDSSLKKIMSSIK